MTTEIGSATTPATPVTYRAGDISPDGKFQFNGKGWVPVPPPGRITVSAGTAFKIGFFGSMGAVVGTAIFWVLLLIAFGGAIAAIVPRK